MFIRLEFTTDQYTRVSKSGKEHTYFRKKTWAVFRCDCCKELFSREKGKMDPKRLNNNYFHCCTNCDAKRFAQSKGAERRTIWNTPVSSTKNIGEL